MTNKTSKKRWAVIVFVTSLLTVSCVPIAHLLVTFNSNPTGPVYNGHDPPTINIDRMPDEFMINDNYDRSHTLLSFHPFRTDSKIRSIKISQWLNSGLKVYNYPAGEGAVDNMDARDKCTSQRIPGIGQPRKSVLYYVYFDYSSTPTIIGSLPRATERKQVRSLELAVEKLIKQSKAK